MVGYENQEKNRAKIKALFAVHNIHMRIVNTVCISKEKTVRN